MAKRVVLAYSGGLDTSVAVRWMTEEMGVEVIALAADLGQGGDWDAVRARAVAAGAVEVVVVDVRAEFGSDFVAPAIRANALYEGRYPLISSLSRPIIVKHLVEAARAHGADAIAHGCTGKGNDQVRFEVSSRASRRISRSSPPFGSGGSRGTIRSSTQSNGVSRSARPRPARTRSTKTSGAALSSAASSKTHG